MHSRTETTMATDYTDLDRKYAVSGREVARAIDVLSLGGPGSSPTGCARILLKEAGAVPADPAIHLPGRADILEAAQLPSGTLLDTGDVGKLADALAGTWKFRDALKDPADGTWYGKLVNRDRCARSILAEINARRWETAQAQEEDEPRCTASSQSRQPGIPSPAARCNKWASHVRKGDPGHVNTLGERWTSTEANPTVTMPVPGGGARQCERNDPHPAHEHSLGNLRCPGVAGRSAAFDEADERARAAMASLPLEDRQEIVARMYDELHAFDENEEKGDPNADEVIAFADAWQVISGLDTGAAERVIIHVAGMLGAAVQF